MSKVERIPTRAQRVRDFFQQMLGYSDSVRCASVVLEKLDGEVVAYSIDSGARELALHALVLQGSAAEAVTARED